MTKKTPPYYFFRILLTGFFIYGMLIYPYYSILRLNRFMAIKPEVKLKRFKELLRSIAEQSITQQKLSLEHTLEQWKGNYEQTDDIIIIGIRIE